jgi:hypothetical protein
MVTMTTCRLLLLVAVVLTARPFRCTAYEVGVDGFSVEFIHRDSVKSPYHDPALTAHDLVRAAVRRSAARAMALGRPYDGNGTVSEVVSGQFEYLMYVNVGTPPTKILAIADTGSDLIWFKCGPRKAAAGAAPASILFDPSSSSTFAHVGCYENACDAVSHHSCAASSNCHYLQAYVDGSSTSGLLCKDTFTFDSIPGGCPGCREHPKLQVPKFNFGCSTSTNSTLVLDGVVGLGAGYSSLIGQLVKATSLGHRFSYCLAPSTIRNASSVLNFGDRAVVTDPSAITTPLVHSDYLSYYTIELESVRIGNIIISHLSRVVVDSGSALTYLNKELLDLMVNEITQKINLPTVQSPEKLLHLCYNVSSKIIWYMFQKNVPDVTLLLADFGRAVTLKVENTFVEIQDGIMCLAFSPVSVERPVAVLGNIAQQNMHIGYDLDKRTVTFAPADCARSYNYSYNSLPVHG